MSLHETREIAPCHFVIFGATGNLAKIKLLPALYHLDVSGHLPPEMTVVALGRRPWTDEQWQENLLESIRAAIIAPDGRDAMLQHAQQMHAAGIPFVFDPGQGLPMFSGDELLRFVEQATWVTVNDYEGKMLCERTGLDLAGLSRKVQGLVVTLGGKGCEVWERGQCTLVAPVAPAAVVDPTGCGDAWRGALLFGLERGWPLARCAELGNRMGALKIAARGPQNYVLDFDPAIVAA